MLNSEYSMVGHGERKKIIWDETIAQSLEQKDEAEIKENTQHFNHMKYTIVTWVDEQVTAINPLWITLEYNW
jgi:hypothetical protein